MNKIEAQILDYLKKNCGILFFVAITAIAVLVRWKGLYFISGDMSACLIPWYECMKEDGVRALQHQVGNYGLLYQTFIALFTYLPYWSVFWYKALSVGFDFLLAMMVALFCSDLKKEKITSTTGIIAYSSVIFLPTVFLNSAYWGQCDSIYTFFCVFSIYKLLKERFKSAYILLGIAFAFKLQAIFIFPFFICYYFFKKNHSIYHYIISLVIFWMSGIVTYLNGRNIFDAFRIYAGQVEENVNHLVLNVASFWIIAGNNADWMLPMAKIFTIALIGFALYMVLTEKIVLTSKLDSLVLVSWIVWVCILFLPCMHERYTYMLDIFLLILTICDRKFFKYFVLSFCLSLITYGSYLFQSEGLSRFLVILYFFAWSDFSCRMLFGRASVRDSQEKKLR